MNVFGQCLHGAIWWIIFSANMSSIIRTHLVSPRGETVTSLLILMVCYISFWQTHGMTFRQTNSSKSNSLILPRLEKLSWYWLGRERQFWVHFTKMVMDSNVKVFQVGIRLIFALMHCGFLWLKISWHSILKTAWQSSYPVSLKRDNQFSQ